MLNKYFRAHHNSLYVVFRVLVGLMFFVHGAQKLFGWFGSKGTSTAFTMFWTAGVVETIAGLLIAVGLFSRLAALFGGIQMIVAYVIAHYPKGIFPYQNGGELALMYLAAFLIVIINGNGKANLEKVICKKEFF